MGIFVRSKPAEPDNVEELVVDRIGPTSLDSVSSFEIRVWRVRFEGSFRIHDLRAGNMGGQRNGVVMARGGDRVRVTWRKGVIVGWENLSMKGSLPPKQTTIR